MSAPSEPLTAPTAPPLAPPAGSADAGTAAYDPNQSDSLAPTTNRIMGKTTYMFTWMGGCISIGTFTMGSSLVGALNLFQAAVAIGIGCLVIGVGLALNGAAGNRWGIPFVIHARSMFGVSGTKIPGLIRAIPAVVWYGFQSWVGAVAINTILDVMFDFNNIILVFVLFQALQIGLSVGGFEGIKWLENIGAIFMLAALIYIFYAVVNEYGSEIGESMNVEGSWGVPFWGATMLFLGIYANMIINVSDYSREHTKGTSGGFRTALYTFALLPVTLFMGVIAFMVTDATGAVDPVDVFSNAVGNPVLLVVTLFSIAFSQVTTNVLNNVVPPTYVLMDIFKMKFWHATVIVGLLAPLTFPWLLVRDESADGLQTFVQIYSAFLGPIFAIMVIDYFFFRKQRLALEELYDTNGSFRGTNWAAVIAVAVGAASAAPFADVGWYVSLIPAAVAYWVLMKVLPSSKRFHPTEKAKQVVLD